MIEASAEQDGSSAPSASESDPAPVALEPAHAAASRWLHQHGDLLWRFALARTRDAGIAEEIVQEVLVAAIEGHGSQRAAISERAWLLGIASHKIVDHHRRLARDRRRAERSRADEQAPPRFNEMGGWASAPSPWPRAESGLERAQQRDALLRCLGRLPPMLAEIVWLRDVMGLGTEAICGIADISRANLWTRLSRARASLRECVQRSFSPDGGVQ